MTNHEPHDVLERRALELLPWYVNGTLRGEELELVRRQVLASLTCRKELDRLRRLQELIRRDDPEAVATDRAFERLMARIESSDAAPQARPGRLGRNATDNWLAYAAALIAGVSALWWWAREPEPVPAIYETMTLPESADTQDATVRVVFAPDVTTTERHALLASHGLSAAGPPTSDGVFTLTFPEDADQSAVVAALRLDPRIRLVTTPPGAARP